MTHELRCSYSGSFAAFGGLTIGIECMWADCVRPHALNTNAGEAQGAEKSECDLSGHAAAQDDMIKA